jgi:hypothetical protein
MYGRNENDFNSCGDSEKRAAEEQHRRLKWSREQITFEHIRGSAHQHADVKIETIFYFGDKNSRGLK